jgi:hypothetical protein
MGNYTISRKRPIDTRGPQSTAVGPEPQLTVRLAEIPATADLSHLTAEAYPQPWPTGKPYPDGVQPPVVKPRKKSGPKPKKVKEIEG